MTWKDRILASLRLGALAWWKRRFLQPSAWFGRLRLRQR